MGQEVVFSVVDGGVGSPPPADANTILVMAPCSSGTPNAIYSIGNSSAIAGTIGEGPGPEVARMIVDLAGVPCLVQPLTTTAGTLSAVTGSAGPVLTPTGTPYDAYDVRVKITAAGAIATAKFVYSLDGGQTYSQEVFTVASYPVPNTGVTIGFAAGTYVLNDVYVFTTTAPSFTSANLNAAFDAAQISDYGFGVVYVVGAAGGASSPLAAAASAAIVASGQAKQLTLFNGKRPVRLLMEAPIICTDADLLSSFASFAGSSSISPAVVAAWGVVQSAMPHGRRPTVNLARCAAVQIAKKSLSKDVSAVSDGAGTGPLPNVLSITRDETKTPGLDAGRFSTVKTFVPNPQSPKGFFMENMRLMSQPGSDYRYWQHGAVMDQALNAARARLLTWLSKPLDTETDGTGKFTEGQARAIEGDVENGVSDAIVAPGHAIAAYVLADRTYNVQTTEEIRVKLKFVPKAYGKKVTLEAGMTLKIPT